MQASDVIADLGLTPHPEGGWYRETYRSSRQVRTPRGPRSALTTIYYLLERHQASRWHVVDADESWHFYAGAPLELLTFAPDSQELTRRILAPPADRGEPVGVVPAGVWQAARSLGDYSLTGCSVGPGFDFADFRLVSAVPGHAAQFAGVLHPYRELL